MTSAYRSPAMLLLHAGWIALVHHQLRGSLLYWDHRSLCALVWLAPEILEQKPYTEKADVYSLGVIFWELLTKQQYFGEIRFMTVLEDMVRDKLLAIAFRKHLLIRLQIKSGNRPPIPDTCIPAYRQLIERCWAQDPSTSAAQTQRILRSDWLTAILRIPDRPTPVMQ